MVLFFWLSSPCLRSITSANCAWSQLAIVSKQDRQLFDRYSSWTFSTNRSLCFHFHAHHRINFVFPLYVQWRDRERIYTSLPSYTSLVWSTCTGLILDQYLQGAGRRMLKKNVTGDPLASSLPAANSCWPMTGLKSVCNSRSAIFFSSFRFSFSSCCLAI